jgi:hypothetical protein
VAVSLVQGVAAAANGSASVTASISSTAAGNLLLAASQCSNSVAALTPSTTGTAQTFTLVLDPTGGAAGQLATWYVTSSASGTTAITVTRGTGTGQFGLAAREIAGMDTTAPLDKNASTTANGSTGTTATTTQADEFWWAVFGEMSPADGTQATYSGISSPWTDGLNAASSASTPNNNATIHDGYQIVAATGTANATITTGNAGPGGQGQVLTFKAAAAGGGGGLPFFMQEANLMVGGVTAKAGGFQ